MQDANYFTTSPVIVRKRQKKPRRVITIHAPPLTAMQRHLLTKKCSFLAFKVPSSGRSTCFSSPSSSPLAPPPSVLFFLSFFLDEEGLFWHLLLSAPIIIVHSLFPTFEEEEKAKGKKPRIILGRCDPRLPAAQKIPSLPRCAINDGPFT